MVPVETAKEALEVSLMARCGFVVASLELGVADVGLAVFAPVFGLFVKSVWGATVSRGMGSWLTVDFQYSDIVAVEFGGLQGRDRRQDLEDTSFTITNLFML